MTAAAAHRATGAPSPARVLIVDDSAVARVVIGRLVDGSDRFAVAGAVTNVIAALAFLTKTTVDFILLDVQMPGVDGITALPDLIAAGGRAKVLIVSSSATDGAAITIQALAFGAADTLEKPALGSLSRSFGIALIDKLDRLRDDPQLPVAAAPTVPTFPRRSRDIYDIVAIGASTGGIHAISQVLRALPQSFPLPILITQHLPVNFMPYFAEQLAAIAGRPCEVATDRMRVRPGRLIVAPGDAHMRCLPLGTEGHYIRLVREPAASGCMPSVDPMFASVAAAFGDRALGVMLSGMGRDGVDGARLMHEAGSAVVVQDQSSSVVWGMPGAVVGQGLADAVLTPAEIGGLIAERRRP